MPEREKAGRKAIEEVQQLRTRVAKLERIALRKAGPKDADRELDRAWSEWETTFDAIGDSVILLDSEFTIVQANAATSSLLGKPLDEIVGQRCCKLVHGSYEPPENCPMVEAKTTKKRQKAEFYIAEKGILALVSVDPILDEQCNLTGAVHIIRGITERRKAEHALGESEERFRKVFEDGPMGMVMADPGTSRFVRANAVFCRILGYTEEELQRMTFLDITHPEHREQDEKQVKKLWAGEIPFYKTEKRYICKNGEVLWGALMVTVVRGADGKPLYSLAMVEDITERKRGEEKIRVFSDAIASAFDCFMLTDEKGNITYVNEAACTTFGYAPEEFLKLNITKLDADPKVAKKITQEVATKGKWSGEVINIRKNGGKFPSFLSAFTIRDEQGNQQGTMGILRDITERKKTEQEVRQSEQKYKELFESAREAIIIMDLNGKITDANRIVEEYGLKREQLLGKSILDFIPVNHRARAAKDFDELCHGTPVKGEMDVIAPKGNLTVEYRDNPIVRGGQIVAVQAILMDITERKKAEEALQAERQRLHDVLEAIPIMVCLLTADYHVAFGNRAFREKFGESHGRRCYEYCFGKKEPCDFCETYRVLKTAKPHHWQVTTPDGASVIDVYDFPFTDVDGLPMILEMDIDITEQKRAEQALRDYQGELKSLASELSLAEERERRRIAAGIHDDIGQKLALAKMELQLLARPPGRSKIPASLDSVCARIDEAIKDAHSLTFELSNPALYDLSFEAAIDLWLLERIEKKHGIKCTVIADEQAVPLDENSKVVLFRALRELVVNAVKHAKATALTVTIEKLENNVQITCKDDGIGFTPPEGRALPSDVGGFGLFNIKERLEYLGGGMKLQSAPGRGTLITLSLPASSWAGKPLKQQKDAGADEGRQ